MRLVFDVAGVTHEVEVTHQADAATLADLIESVTGSRPPDNVTVWVDNLRYTSDTPASKATLLEGSTIGQAQLSRPQPVHGWSVTVSGGMDAGLTVPVPKNRPLLVGRSPHADIVLDSASASWSHASFTREDDGVRVKDLGSTNGTLVDGHPITASKTAEEPAESPDSDSKDLRRNDSNGSKRLRFGSSAKDRDDDTEAAPDGVLLTDEAVVMVGGTTLTLRPDLHEVLAPAPGTLNNVTPAGTVPFNRPPRPGRLEAPEPVETPTRKDEPPPARFNIATVAAPLLMAVGMVIVMRSPMYAMIALLSPLIGVGTYYESKRRRRLDIEEEDKRYADALDKLDQDISDAGAVERTRRRDDSPDPAVTLRRASLPTTRMWQRRPGAEDYLTLHAGVGDVPWKPEVDSRTSSRMDDTVKKRIRTTALPGAPIRVELTDADVVGIVGDRDGALAVARSLLCQAAVHCGPADLTIGVFCDQGRDEAWSWTTWLPHVRMLGNGSGGQWVSADRQRSESLLRSLRDTIDEHSTPTVLLLLDSDILTEGRDAPARALLGHGRPLGGPAQQKKQTQVSGIVVASTEEALPASVSVVIRVGQDAHGTVSEPGELTTVEDVVLAGISVDSARRCALDLARFDDPELVVPGAALPGLVRLPPLLGFDSLDADTVKQAWSSATRISTPIGIGEHGALELDLVRDGPHGLVGGTTGSGKSEFLRSFVAGLAARNDPTKLTFILIDFKGGAAFATCERLPHTIGTVSNLDEQLADRALRALEAEMRYRQEMFAAAGEGIDNLNAYLATNPAEPMPRLLLVVDEFAMLAKEYPDVLSSLVSVAAVGRTLGVHMVLATQRPAGVVNDDILANTNLRVALRVQSREDSTNVIGVPAASAIGRTQMGRAFVKLGQDDITPVQTALVTGRAEEASASLVEFSEVVFGGSSSPAPRSVAPASDSDETDLDLLIDAIVAANDDLGYAPPRPVWPEPLGERVGLAGVGEHLGDEPVVGAVRGDVVQFALSDQPDRQRQIPAGWDTDEGNLLLLGIPGSGTSTALASIALTMAAATSPEDLDIVVLDLGTRDLQPLEQLPHTAAYVGSGLAAREQQVRFLKFLRKELDRRRADARGHRKMLVLVDGLASLKDEFGDDFDAQKLLGGLYTAYAEGPDVGMHFAVSSTRAKGVPPQMEEVTTQKWLFRLADPYDYASAGLDKRLAPPPVPGRCVPANTKLQTHVASPGCPLPQAVDEIGRRWEGHTRKSTVVGQLPEEVAVGELGAEAQVSREPWRIPIGIRESDLEPGFVEVYEGEHVLVAGPARSGKSTLLLAVKESIEKAAAESGQEIAIWGVCTRRSPLVDAGLEKLAVGEDGLAALLATARVHRGPLVILFDDTEKFEDADQSIQGLIGARTSDLLLVCAGRSDELRTMYSHWTKQVRKSRAGVVLQPNIDYDGELFGGTLPRRAPVELTVGRGYLAAGGGYELVQTMSPDADVTRG